VAVGISWKRALAGAVYAADVSSRFFPHWKRRRARARRGRIGFIVSLFFKT